MNKRLLELEPNNLFGNRAVLVAFTGYETISKPFEFMLHIDSEKLKIQPQEVIGKALSVRVDRGDAEPRYFHGYVNAFSADPTQHSKEAGVLPTRGYRVQIVPWLRFLGYASRCFVYLPEKPKKSIQDIIDVVLSHVKDYGHVENWNDCSGAALLKQRSVEHCIQYRETDLEFFTRVLARYGIGYFFRFEKDKHTLVLFDKANYPKCAEPEVSFPPELGTQVTKDRIISWDRDFAFVSGSYEQIDYDFTKPSISLKVKASKHGRIALSDNGKYEYYDSSNDYSERTDGREEVARRLESVEVAYDTVTGESTHKLFTAGSFFDLKLHHANPEEAGKQYLLTSVYHNARQPGRTVSSGDDQTYINRFTCIPKEAQFRPPMATGGRTISGPHTAFVVGPNGEEIYTDPHGRVKVQFHWDREGKKDENTCCWVRVSQIHAGRSFGGIDIPRVGEEVIVSYVEGDIDRPLITGRLYNAESMPPFSLPSEKTRCGIKTKTYKGSGYNELSMDDTAGKEQIRIHGEHNLDTLIKHDETHVIQHNRTKTVDNDEIAVVGGSRTAEVAKDESITIGQNQRLTVAQNETIQIGGNLGTTVGKELQLVISGGQSLSIGKDSATQVSGGQSATVGKSDTLSVGENRTVSVGGNDGLSVAKSLTIEAGTEIVLQCGSSSITLKKSGDILIKGKNIKIDGSGKIDVKASGDVKIKGSKILEN